MVFSLEASDQVLELTIKESLLDQMLCPSGLLVNPVSFNFLLRILLSQNIHPPCLVSLLTPPAHDGQESCLVSGARSFLTLGIFS